MNPGIVDRELHPVGTRLLVTLSHYDGTDTTIYEVIVQEWSPGGLVKLRYDNRGDEEDWGSWHRPEEIRVVEQLTGGSL